MRVLVLSVDHLAASALQATLAGEGLEAVLEQRDVPVEVVLCDTGPDPQSPWLPARGTYASGPLVMLVAAGADYRQVLTEGLAALLRRDAEPPALAAALRAAVVGLTVFDGTAAPALARMLRPARAPLEPLSDRERQVLQLVAAGLANKAIGQRLAISPHTVKFHVAAILAKLHAQSRTEAVVTATRAGLLTL